MIRRLLAVYLALCVLLGVAFVPAAQATRVCRMTGRPMAAAHHACCHQHTFGGSAASTAVLSASGCCCKVTAAPERTPTPALAPQAGPDLVAWFARPEVSVAPATLLTRAPGTLPLTASVPRAPPLRQAAPRAPPSLA